MDNVYLQNALNMLKYGKYHQDNPSESLITTGSCWSSIELGHLLCLTVCSFIHVANMNGSSAKSWAW